MTEADALQMYARRRDPEAFAMLVQQYQRLVLATCRRQLYSSADVDDAVQETFLRLAGKAGSLRDNIGAWLHRCAVNVSRDLNRRQRARGRHEKAAAEIRIAENAAAQPIMAKLYAKLDAALEQIPVAQRELLIERYYVGRQQSEMAQRRGVSPATISRQINKAVASLRVKLESAGCDATVAAGAGSLVGLLASDAAAAEVPAALTSSLMKIGLGGVPAATSAAATGGAVVGGGLASKAAAAVAVMAVLLAGGGIAVHQGWLAREEPAANVTPVSWEDRFNEVYGLDEGEVVRHIPEPFIPERMEFYWQQSPTQAERIPSGPAYIHLRWDGALQRQGMGFGFRDGVPFSNILGFIGLRTYELQASEEAMNLRFSGDWVVRDDTTAAERLDALAGIVEEQFERRLVLDFREVERDVIVARGAYEFSLLEGTYDDTRIHIYGDVLDANRTGGGGGGDVDALLGRMGGLVALRVFNETEGDSPEFVQWATHQSSRLWSEPEGEQRDAKLRTLLENVSRQTGLEFAIERRVVPIWFIELEQPPPQAIPGHGRRRRGS